MSEFMLRWALQEYNGILNAQEIVEAREELTHLLVKQLTDQEFVTYLAETSKINALHAERKRHAEEYIKRQGSDNAASDRQQRPKTNRNNSRRRTR